MDAFEVYDADSSACLRFQSLVPRGLTGYDGCQFIARFSCNPVSAVVRVYDVRSDKLCDLFFEMSENCRGWTGANDRESMEGHLRL